MCGIVGVVGLGRPVDVAGLQKMNDRQQHRGPDGEGFLLAWPNGDEGGGGGGRLRHAFLPHSNRWNAAVPVTLILWLTGNSEIYWKGNEKNLVGVPIL